ncbi:MAG: porin [Boseongicola sp. SB0675_bin_26]|nr:porin [Boseongicola sp. SB0675_bin_26]
MKRILLTSTALVMSAGIAAAEPEVGGDGLMGVISKAANNDGDITFTSRVRATIKASGETDNGLMFGGEFGVHDAVGAKDGQNGSVFVQGPFGKFSMGDVNSAAKTAVGNAGGVGLTGLDDLNEVKYIGKAHKPSALWSYDMGALSLYASSDNPGPSDDTVVSGALSYSIGEVTAAAGVERAGDMQIVAASVSASLGDASVKLVYGSYDDGMAGSDNVDSYSASASFNTGMATFSAFTSGNSKGVDGQDHFGIGASFDLGGGASIVGGFVDGDSLSDGSFDLGISMSF